MMQPLGDQFLAGTALADYQNRAVERRGAARPLDRVEEGEALPDELRGPLHTPTVGGKAHDLARYFSPISRENSRFCRYFGICRNMARLLYSILAIGPYFDCGERNEHFFPYPGHCRSQHDRAARSRG